MYSCHKKRESVVKLNTTAFAGFKSVDKCRFDMRYTPEHQKLGCGACGRPWDYEYLIKQGLLK